MAQQMCLLQLSGEKEEDSSHGNNALLRQPRGRNGPQPSVQTATNSLISKSCILILTFEMWKRSTISFPSQSRKDLLYISGMIPRAGNLKEGINTFKEYTLHARPWAQCFTIIISFNSHHNLVRQLIFPPFYWWSSFGSKWSRVIA